MKDFKLAASASSLLLFNTLLVSLTTSCTLKTPPLFITSCALSASSFVCANRTDGRQRLCVAPCQRKSGTYRFFFPRNNRVPRPIFWIYLSVERVGVRSTTQSTEGSSHPSVSRDELHITDPLPLCENLCIISALSFDFPLTCSESNPCLFNVAENFSADETRGRNAHNFLSNAFCLSIEAISSKMGSTAVAMSFDW